MDQVYTISFWIILYNIHILFLGNIQVKIPFLMTCLSFLQKQKGIMIRYIFHFANTCSLLHPFIDFTLLQILNQIALSTIYRKKWNKIQIIPFCKWLTRPIHPLCLWPPGSGWRHTWSVRSCGRGPHTESVPLGSSTSLQIPPVWPWWKSGPENQHSLQIWGIISRSGVHECSLKSPYL